MYPTPAKCHICGNRDVLVTKVYCPNCDTTIEGHFIPSHSPFAGLTDEQMQFSLAFIRCEGRFTRLEEDLNLSYPTLRNRLNEVVRALGYEPGKDDTPAKLTAEERNLILEDLGRGKITPAEAQALLRGKEPGES